MAVAEETLIPRSLRDFDLRQGLFFAYIAIALVLFVVLPPPFQKPDEPAHFYRAVSLTNLDLTCSRNAEGVYGFQMKRKYSDLPDAMHVWEVALRGSEPKFNRDWLRIDFSGPSYEQEVGVHDICGLAPPGYLPIAAGVLLGKPFHNPLVSFYLARVFGALFFAVMLVWALRVTPEAYRLPVYFYAALPMVLHQVSAVSYDAVQLSLFPLIYAYLTRFASLDGAIKRSELAVFLIALWWAANTRTLAYAPLLLLFFAVPWGRIAPNPRRYFAIAAGFFAICLVTFLVVGLVYLRSYGPPVQETHIEANTAEQVRFVIEHPTRFVSAIYETLRQRGDWLLKEGIGVFGWDDTELGFMPYYGFVAIGAAVLYYAVQRATPVLAPHQIAVILGVCTLTVLSVFFSLYAAWTPVGADEVDGVQGRYLIGLIPLGIFGVAQLATLMGKRRFIDMLLVAFVPILLFNIYRAIDLRYFD